MAKMFKRGLALAMALILVMGQLAMPVRAEDSAAEPTPELTLDLENATPAPAEEPAPAADPEPKVTVNFENTTEKTDEEGNVISSETVGQKTVETPIPDGTQTDVVDYSSGYEINNQPNVVSQHEYGEENTDTTITTETETKEENKPTGDTYESDEPVQESSTEGQNPTTSNESDMDQDENWEKGTTTSDNEYTGEQIVVGGEKETVTTTEGPTDLGAIVPEDDLSAADNDVTLVMTPSSMTDEERRNVTLEEIQSGRYPEIFDPKSVPAGTDVKVEEYRDADGKFLGWKVTKTTVSVGERQEAEYSSTDGHKTVSGTTSSVSMKEYEDKVAAGPQVTQSEDGKTTTTESTTRITKDGKEGYKDVKETVTVETSTSTQDVDADEASYPTTSVPVTTNEFTLPTNVPANSSTVNADGTTTVVTVTNLYDDLGELTNPGDHVGYSISTITYDADGKVMETHVQDIFGTATTTTVTTEMNPTTLEILTTTTTTQRNIEEVFTQQYSRDVTVNMEKSESFVTTTVTDADTYQLVETAGGMYFLYKGQMFAVTAVKGEHGTTETFDATNKENIDHTFGKSDDIQNTGFTNWKGEANGHLITGASNTSTPTDAAADGKWTHTGTGLVSAFYLKDKDGDLHQARQFRIQDGDTVRYVYCVEMNQSASGAVYSNNMNGQGNLGGNTYWKGDEEQLRSVSLNGFWGTKEGIGSLDAVKDLLRRNGYEAEAEALTAGEALAATQAAVWEYGSDEGYQLTGNFVGLDNTTGDRNLTSSRIYTLKNLLVTLAEKDAADGRTGAAQAINANSITQTGITLNHQVQNQDGTAKTVDHTVKHSDGTTETVKRDVYNTDVMFKINVSQTSINGNMTIELLDENNNPIGEGKYRLAGQDAGVLSQLTRIRPDANGVYTIPNVEIAEGVKVTLKLQGTQHLDDGIYIYNNPTKQDFVGLASKDHDVSLEFGIKFTVEDPAMNHSTEKVTQNRTDKAVSTKSESRTDTIDITYKDAYSEKRVEVHHDKKLLGTETVVTLVNQRTKERLRWDRYAEYPLEVIDDEDGGGNDGGGGGTWEETFTILDEEVPLADAPITGDLTLLWATVSLFSLAGAAVLKKKEEE